MNWRKVGKESVHLLYILGIANAGWQAKEIYDRWSKPDLVVSTERAVALTKESPYWLMAHVNGNKTLAMLDSGASKVSMSPDMAKKLNVKTLGKLEPYGMANGIDVMCREGYVNLRMGGIVLKKVATSVCEGKLEYVLIGQSALRQLKVTSEGAQVEIQLLGEEK